MRLLPKPRTPFIVFILVGMQLARCRLLHQQCVCCIEHVNVQSPPRTFCECSDALRTLLTVHCILLERCWLFCSLRPNVVGCSERKKSRAALRAAVTSYCQTKTVTLTDTVRGTLDYTGMRQLTVPSVHLGACSRVRPGSRTAGSTPHLRCSIYARGRSRFMGAG